MAQSFTFAELTPDLILDAIEDTGIRVDSGLLALNSYENRVYQFMDEDRTRFVVKFYRPQRWSNAQIQEEHDYSLELLQHEIPIAAPLIINNKTLHHYKDYAFTIFPSVGGRQFEVDNLNQLEWMGRFIGRIHAVAASKQFEFRDELTIQSHLHIPFQQLQNSKLVPSHLHTSFFTILERVVELASTLYTERNLSPPLRLHGDCHPGNILWRDGPTFVDLDDCRNGPAIQDIWMMLSGDRQQQTLQLDTLIGAYEEFFDFNNAQLGLIEPLRAMRMIHYMAWLENRWEDPAFPRAFPWFADDKYWEQQILSLKEQFSSLQEPSISLMP